MQYVGQACRALQKRFGEHYRRMKGPKPIGPFLYQYFKRTGHSPNDVLVQPVEKLTYDKNSSSRFKIIKRHETELKWIKLLQTPFPLGFNGGVCREGNISKMPDFDVFSLLEIRKRKSRSHGVGKRGGGRRGGRAVGGSGASLRGLSGVLGDHGRRFVLSFLGSLPVSVLRVLDTEANKFYDRNHQLYDAALLTRCYTQHALRPFIDSEINHRRHFIKIPFINKGIEFIGLPGVFGGGSVASSMPAYFQNSEPPIICYRYNKPIRNTVFNFNKLVSDLDIHANTPESWGCGGSGFVCPAAGHVVAGGLRVVSDSRVRCMVSGGPECGFPSRVGFGECGEEVASALSGFGGRWCGREYVGPGALGGGGEGWAFSK